MSECHNCGDCTHGDEQRYCSTACQLSDQYRNTCSVGGLSNGVAYQDAADASVYDQYFADLAASDLFPPETHATPETHVDCIPPPSPVPYVLYEPLGAKGTKPTNPKDIIGADKIPLHLWPETATVLGSLALLDGALKYGRSNFRAVGVKASIYVDAAKRHLNAFFEGQNEDPDSGLPHLAHALACIASLVDAEACGKLNDDRMYPGGYLATVALYTRDVARLKAKHADKSPKHFTLEDEPVRP